MPADRVEDDHVGITMEQDNRAELVVGTHGRGAGLWDAMQAVFSPVGADGYPKPIWDKRTGAIDREVADYWRDHYDLSYILRRDWTTIGPKLVGKIHLTVGTSDQWYLANAVRYVDAFLKSTKDPAYEGSVEYGTRFIHCYQGDPDAPLAASSRTALPAADAGDGGAHAENGAGRRRRQELEVLVAQHGRLSIWSAGSSRRVFSPPGWPAASVPVSR